MRRDRDPEVAFDEFLALWEKFLAEANDPATVTVVEGERDRRSLRRLGLTGPIAIVHRGRSLAATALALSRSRRVILLTDWDTEGGHLAQRLREHLEAGTPALDLDYRRRLAHLLRGELAHVEGLYGWARRSAERYRRPLEFEASDPEDAGVPRPTG
jgi:5S rRNA maturation endonuclease (ribonuclease M5)